MIFGATLDLGTWGQVAGLIGLVFGAVAFAWALARSRALEAWKEAAGGYKESKVQLEERLGRAEVTITALNTQITKLESMPDMTDVADLINAQATRVEKSLADQIERESRRITDEISRQGGKS